MGGLTIDDFTNSAVYKEIFGQGRSEGLQEGQREGLERGQREGRQAEAAALTLRLLQRRCGPLTPQQQARLQALPLAQLEALADALLDFQGPDDLTTWLQANGG
jgi:predicted transposase YdaD